MSIRIRERPGAGARPHARDDRYGASRAPECAADGNGAPAWMVDTSDRACPTGKAELDGAN